MICFLLIVTRASNCFDCEDADVSDVYQIKRDSQRLSFVTLMLIWETFYSFSFLQLFLFTNQYQRMNSFGTKRR